MGNAIVMSHMQLSDIVQIESTLAAGHSSTVFKAWHKRLQKHVAVKKQTYAEKVDIEIKHLEAEALKSIKSMYVPYVFDFLTEGSESYTILEFIEGESLDKPLIRGQKFSRKQIIKWYKQLALALDAIHKRDVYHRDIKPANIILMPNGDVCLIDFNSAYITGMKALQFSRSKGYASPEQLAIFHRYKSTQTFTGTQAFTQSKIEISQPEHDGKTELIQSQLPRPEISTPTDIDWARSDIYSLGATMRHLFTGTQHSNLVNKTTSSQAAKKDTHSVMGIIHKSTRPKPTERFKNSEQLLAALRNVNK